MFGYKGKLASAAGCQRAYLSQVLGSHVHFTPDHAAGLTNFWALKPDERDYFIELVNYARAATPALQKIIKEKLKYFRSKNETVSGRIKKPVIGELEFVTKYYSSWHYSAIHILLTVSAYRSVPKISERLNLSPLIVTAALRDLADGGLAELKGNMWLPKFFDLHLPASSPMISVHHQNWRTRAVINSIGKDEESLHFTGVYSLSQQDAHNLRSLLLEFVSNTRKTALASLESEVFSFCCDLFRI